MHTSRALSIRRTPRRARARDSRSVLLRTALATLLLVPAGARAQSLDLGVVRTGVSIGNSPRWNGLRINWVDRGVQRVNGLNITIWKPEGSRDDDRGANPDFTMNGIALGIVAPDAARFNGLAAGIGGVVAHEAINGIALGGLGVVSNGAMHGISLGGLGIVAEGRMRGIQLAGLGLVSEGPMTGIQLAGLGLVAEGPLSGISLAGLGTVSQGPMTGINVAGLGVVAEQDMTGVNVGGLGLVSQQDMVGINLSGLGSVAQGRMAGLNVAGIATVASGEMQGINVSGLAIVAEGGLEWVSLAGLAVIGERHARGLTAAAGAVLSDRSIEGVAAAAYRVQAPQVSGVALALAHLRAENLTGFGTGVYTRIDGVQRGLTIAIYNRARELHGVQVGVLNRADNHTGWRRILPVLNFHP